MVDVYVAILLLPNETLKMSWFAGNYLWVLFMHLNAAACWLHKHHTSSLYILIRPTESAWSDF